MTQGLTARTARYAHDALFYDSDADLVSVSVDFVSEGLDQGERVLVVCGPDQNERILDALAAYGSRVSVIGQADVYPRVGRAIAFYRRFAERAVDVGAPRVRVLGEVPFTDDQSRWAEWGRFESVCNAALADLPLWSVCAYAAQTTPPAVAAAARLTHPNLVADGHRTANHGYVDPDAYLAMGNGLEGAASMTTPAVLTLSSLRSGEDLRRARHRLRAALGPALFVGSGVGDDFVTATTEVLINALTHGRPPATLRFWTDADRAVCTVTDHGSGFTDQLVGYWHSRLPTAPSLEPSGLWLARQLCDDITFQHTDEGFTVRLHTSLR